MRRPLPTARFAEAARVLTWAFALQLALAGPTLAQTSSLPGTQSTNPAVSVLPIALQAVPKLIRTGNYAQALTTIESHLKNDPDSIPAQFFRGVVFAETKRSTDAIEVFSDLIARHPQLPEPYNNLAVLYAANGQYHRARDALEQAVAANAQSPLVHENLGDVYARLAAASYERATKLEPTNRGVRAKLTLIRNLAEGRLGTDQTKPPSPLPSATNNGDPK
ncbi:MAG: tetratricopeptide repeat protein [Burkholderiales bacterium]